MASTMEWFLEANSSMRHVELETLIESMGEIFSWGRPKMQGYQLKHHRPYILMLKNLIGFFLLSTHSMINLLRTKEMTNSKFRVVYELENTQGHFKEGALSVGKNGPQMLLRKGILVCRWGYIWWLPYRNFCQLLYNVCSSGRRWVHQKIIIVSLCFETYNLF